MKKLKTRKTHTCCRCKRSIPIGSIAVLDGPPVYTTNMYYHLRCYYGREASKLRFNRFVMKCPHPEKMRVTVWTYIPGECVKEPDHDECRICGRYI